MKLLSNPFMIFGIAAVALVYAFIDLGMASCNQPECMTRSGHWAIRIFIFCFLWWLATLGVKWIKQLNKK